MILIHDEMYMTSNQQRAASMAAAPEAVREKIHFADTTDTRTAVIVHGANPSATCKVLQQRATFGILEYIIPTLHRQYDALIFTGGLKDLPDGYHLQPELTLKQLQNFAKAPDIQTELYHLVDQHEDRLNKGIRYEAVRGSKEVIFDCQRHLRYQWKGNSFYHEMQEIMQDYPSMQLMISPVEEVMVQHERLLQATRYAVEPAGFVHTDSQAQSVYVDPETSLHGKLAMNHRILHRDFSRNSPDAVQRHTVGHTIMRYPLPQDLSLTNKVWAHFYECMSAFIYLQEKDRMEKLLHVLRK